MRQHNPPYLEKYAGRKSRHKCPACHDKSSFTYYLDGDTEQIIDKSVGRCDHESSCGYHYPPKQFFADNPHRRENSRHEPSKYPHRTAYPQRRAPEQIKEVGVIPDEYVSRSLGGNSDFVKFLCTLYGKTAVECPDILRVLDDYHIGSTRAGHVIFWQIDTRKRARTGKVIRYNPTTGKRIKGEAGAIDWIHAKLQRKGLLPDDFNLVQCLFGEHLLTKYPDKVVALVEGEKSAVIGACIFPDYVWVATGGKSQLSAKRLSVLRGRAVIMFPDVDAYVLWCEKARELKAMGINITVSDILEKNATPAERKEQIDIADWLIRDLQRSDDDEKRDSE